MTAYVLTTFIECARYSPVCQSNFLVHETFTKFTTSDDYTWFILFSFFYSSLYTVTYQLVLIFIGPRSYSQVENWNIF